LVAETQVRLWLRQKNISAASDWAEVHQAESVDNLDAAGEIEQITVAQVFAIQRKFNDALDLLTQLLDSAQAANRMENVLKIWILQAVIYQSQQKIDSAMYVLEKALSFAESEGYTRIFIDHGEPMEQLLRSALMQGIAPNLVARLLEKSEEGSESFQVLINPLSERETEVLRLIVAGLSNQGIADELIIAESTVKTHINHIYSKLNVTSRTQAVAKARELKLL